jgi:glycosyltransferase involved in cell wall biosynthesis
MKVVMLCSYRLSGPLYEGSWVINAKMPYYLSRLGDIELHIITEGIENREFKKDNLYIHMLKRRKLVYVPYLSPILLWRMKCETEEINPDIVHAVSTSYFYSCVAAFLRRKYPAVLTAYGIMAKEWKYTKEEYTKIRHHLFMWVPRLCERYLLSKITNIIILTPINKSVINKMTDSKTYAVTERIEFEKIRGYPPHKSEKPDVLFMSSLEKLKGVDILIKAIPVVLNSVPDISVYIAGTGAQEWELKKQVKELNLEAHVKFLGLITDEEEKYSYYKACKVVVAPSRWDCQPYAVTEGAACGKPIIASDMSNPALLDDGKAGFIFQSENAVDLANKIIKLLRDDRLREEMGKAALEKARECDWNRIVEQLVEIYKEVIADFHERKERG